MVSAGIGRLDDHHTDLLGEVVGHLPAGLRDEREGVVAGKGVVVSERVSLAARTERVASRECVRGVEGVGIPERIRAAERLALAKRVASVERVIAVEHDEVASRVAVTCARIPDRACAEQKDDREDRDENSCPAQTVVHPPTKTDHPCLTLPGRFALRTLTSATTVEWQRDGTPARGFQTPTPSRSGA